MAIVLKNQSLEFCIHILNADIILQNRTSFYNEKSRKHYELNEYFSDI